jgi:hypothetical protein
MSPQDERDHEFTLEFLKESDSLQKVVIKDISSVYHLVIRACTNDLDDGQIRYDAQELSRLIEVFTDKHDDPVSSKSSAINKLASNLELGSMAELSKDVSLGLEDIIMSRDNTQQTAETKNVPLEDRPENINEQGKKVTCEKSKILHHSTANVFPRGNSTLLLAQLVTESTPLNGERGRPGQIHSAMSAD